jgi:acetyl esterase/lipase
MLERTDAADPRDPRPSLGAVVENLRMLRARPAFEDHAPTASGVAFRPNRGDMGHALADVWIPAAPTTRASVLLVHGGGFVIGSRHMKPMRLLASRLFAAGVAVASIDYRLALSGGRLHTMIDDVRAALDWWRGELPSHGLDPDAVTLAGASAGASLSWLATAATDAPPARLAAIYGVYDLRYLGRGKAALLGRLVAGTRDADALFARSPLATPALPLPVLLVHGTADRLVPYDQAQRLHDARLRAGLSTELLRCDGEPHGFLNDAARPASETVVQTTLRFALAALG